MQGNSKEVAKIYKEDKITRERADKLKVMLHNPPDDPTVKTLGHRSIAWPLSVLFYDYAKTGLAGYTMPLIDTNGPNGFKESHRYYDPSDRRKLFKGGFTWKHLMVTALNISSATGAIHEKGHCVGDLRELNILVSPNALITFVDCDSFQVFDGVSKTTYYTRVGTGEYLPPELQSADFNQDIDRRSSDIFALGIIVFKFLMMGVHPYQARGTLVDDAPTTEQKIKKGLFPYTVNYASIQPPLYAPPYDIIPSSIQRLFADCFDVGHKTPSKRPTAQDWYNALKMESKRIKNCDNNTNHSFAYELQSCPWCRIKEDYFPANAAGIGNQVSLPPPTANKNAQYYGISFCSECNEPLQADWLYCPNCNTPVDEMV
ncbi:Serine/threonine protein kinase-like domain protein [Candidatus Magnetobacterium bavaricum]|uniref:Serine/threonine protein kinase-like domain protein n=1 Tax=Candidatus Magnetobacterium bavaricum TaxID=29290 RepID=A0A0F3GKT8_9BACT|nr:Serine/threonine protein kinase-like domain protein [Candidatus Magnetobacterium bavaricum]